jgi:hypothetical protein
MMWGGRSFQETLVSKLALFVEGTNIKSWTGAVAPLDIDAGPPTLRHIIGKELSGD